MTSKSNPLKTPTQLRNAAVEAHHANDLEQAETLYRRYLYNCPNDGAIWSNLGALYRKTKRYPLAKLAQLRALRLDPNSVSLMNNASNAYFDAGDVAGAEILREKILSLDDSRPENYASLVKCYRSNQKLDLALQTAQEGLEKFPQDPEIHIQHAFSLLAKGDYPNGFKAFQWRWQGDEINLPDFEFPQWSGQDLQGKTLLVTPEQGFGDTVLMARFLPALARRGATIKMVVKPPLQNLFKELSQYFSLANTKADIADCDYWTPMMDLPLHLGTTLDSIPAPAQLHIPKDAQKRAQHLVAPYKKHFKLGVLWSGSVTYRANHKRSFSHNKFLELADIENLQMFSLYKGPLLERFQSDGSSTFIIDAASSDRDFADSAALMRELDLVISMDSAIVHVAGSLGVPVWNLLHSEPYWLYQPYADHTPWYPSMRLIKQQTAMDWDTTFAQLRTKLTQHIKDWTPK